MSYALQQNPQRRIGGLIFVGLLHLGILYALVNGLGRQAIEVLRQPLVTKIIEEVKPADELPTPPALKFTPPPPPYIPPPEVAVQAPASSNAIAVVTTVKPAEPVVAPPPPAPVAAPVVAAVHVPAVLDAKHSCQKPEYPPSSRRAEETGVTGLLFLVDGEGGVLEGKVENSSGHPRLDETALAALSKCKFKPGTVDGKPEQTWARLNYKWQLN